MRFEVFLRDYTTFYDLRFGNHEWIGNWFALQNLLFAHQRTEMGNCKYFFHEGEFTSNRQLKKVSIVLAHFDRRSS